MDEELREMIEIARVEAEFALLEIKIHGAVHAKEAQRHMEALIVKLDEFLLKTHWSKVAPPGGTATESMPEIECGITVVPLI